MNPLTALIVSVVFITVPAAYSGNIYSWIDDKGVRHFSNLTPPVSEDDIDIIPGFDSPAAETEREDIEIDSGDTPYPTSPPPAAVPRIPSTLLTAKTDSHPMNTPTRS